MTGSATAAPPRGPRSQGACPKSMSYGPCGGVRHDGGCEVSPDPCVFLGLPDTAALPVPTPPVPHVPGATGQAAGGEELLARAAAGTLVVTGLPARAMDSGSLRACAERLAVGGAVDAVLMGDSGRDRVQFPPSYRAMLLQEAGLAAWPGVNCRDRNRVALEGELAALADLGVGGVHCVTGDHTSSGHRPDAAPVFDLESTELVALAHGLGLATSVAESPMSPPISRRASRVGLKARAGADLCFLQYAGEVDEVARFVAEVAATAPALRVLPGVPVLTDAAGARLLGSFAAAVLPAGYVDRVLGAPDPRSEGIAAAVELARMLLAIEGVGGVVLAGGPALGSETDFASDLAEVARQIRD